MPTPSADRDGRSRPTGGSRSTSVTINLKSLVEKMVFEGGLGESRSEMERQVSEVLLRVLNMAQASVS